MVVIFKLSTKLQTIWILVYLICVNVCICLKKEIITIRSKGKPQKKNFIIKIYNFKFTSPNINVTGKGKFR